MHHIQNRKNHFAVNVHAVRFQTFQLSACNMSNPQMNAGTDTLLYRELTASVGQAEYIFDITDEKCEEESMLQAIKKMIRNYAQESEIIKSHIQGIQSENCFECISEWVKNNYE